MNEDDTHVMATHLREGLVAKVPDVVLDGEVEADEVYVIAGHKGNPEAVKKKAARDAAARRVVLLYIAFFSLLDRSDPVHAA